MAVNRRMVRPTVLRLSAVVLAFAGAIACVAQQPKVLTVAPAGAKPAGQFTAVQDAVTAAPDTGAGIRIAPGSIARWPTSISRTSFFSALAGLREGNLYEF